MVKNLKHGKRREIGRLEHRIQNLEEQLGWEGGAHDRLLLKQIQRTQARLEELKSQPVPKHPLPATSYQAVKEFLAWKIIFDGPWGTRTHNLLLGKQDLSFLATSFVTTRSASLSSVSGDREASTPLC